MSRRLPFGGGSGGNSHARFQTRHFPTPELICAQARALSTSFLEDLIDDNDGRNKRFGEYDARGSSGSCWS